MESDLFEDWHLPNLILPQPNLLPLPPSLSDFLCEVTIFEDAMDESLARLALFNVSPMREIVSKATWLLEQKPNLVLYLVRRSKIFVSVATLFRVYLNYFHDKTMDNSRYVNLSSCSSRRPTWPISATCSPSTRRPWARAPQPNSTSGSPDHQVWIRISTGLQVTSHHIRSGYSTFTVFESVWHFKNVIHKAIVKFSNVICV